MTKIHSINSDQLYFAQNAEVSLKLAGNTAQVTFTAGKNKKCPIKNISKDILNKALALYKQKGFPNTKIAIKGINLLQ